MDAVVDDSILDTIKDLVGVSVDDTVFDGELIVAINTALFTLNQIGVGPYSPFRITGNSETWSDFISDIDDFSAVKTYVYLRTRMIFDPPVSSNLMTAMKEQIQEYEWRLNVAADHS